MRSQGHVLYAAAWLDDLLSATRGPVTLVTMDAGGFLGHEAVTDAALTALLPDSPRLTRVSVADVGLGCGPDEQLTYLAVGSPGIKPWLRLRAAHPTDRLPVVVTDEGLGSYGTWRTRRDAWCREGVREPWTTVRALATTVARRLLTTTRWATYVREGGAWSVRPQMRQHFERAVTPDPNDTLVLLTQPWVEMGVVDAGVYLAQVAEGARAASAAGLDFLVRPHPAEDPERYRTWAVAAGSAPAELDPRIVGAAVIAGGPSTALLNLAAIHQRPALRLGVPGLDLEGALSDSQRTLLDTFTAPPTTEPFATRLARHRLGH